MCAGCVCAVVSLHYQTHSQTQTHYPPISRELDEKRLMWCTVAGTYRASAGSFAALGQMIGLLCVKWELRAPVACLRNLSMAVADRDGTDKERQAPLPSLCRYFDVQLLSSGLWWPDNIERETERSLWRSLRFFFYIGRNEFKNEDRISLDYFNAAYTSTAVQQNKTAWTQCRRMCSNKHKA